MEVEGILLNLTTNFRLFPNLKAQILEICPSAQEGVGSRGWDHGGEYARFRVQTRVVWGLGFKVSGLGFRVKFFLLSCFVRVSGFGFWVPGFVRVSDL